MEKVTFPHPTVSLIFVFLILITTLNLPALAQGMCPLTTLRVSALKGKVVTPGRPLDEPLAYTKIELKKLNEEETLISSTLTNDQGIFEIKNVKNGQYRLVVWFMLGGKVYYSYYVKSIVKNSPNRQNKSSILVKLGLNCNESEASLVAESDPTLVPSAEKSSRSYPQSDTREPRSRMTSRDDLLTNKQKTFMRKQISGSACKW